ncbi:MAG: Ig-like domain-containing protein [Acidobacteriota bacterium]
MAVGLVATWATVQASALLPNLLLTSPSQGQILSGVVTLTASADATGLSALQFQVSGSDVGSAITSGVCATSWDTRTVGDGVRTITAVGRDSVGNLVTSLPVLVTVLNAASDTTDPTVSVSSPATGATVSGSVVMTAAATDNTGIAGVWFTVDDAIVGVEDALAPYQATWSTAGTSNGPHTIVAYARDPAGNSATSASVTVTVANTTTDRTAPSVSVTTPSAGATVSGTTAVTAAASDNVGVIGVQFTVDGANLGGEVTSSPYGVVWNTGGVSNGSHALRAIARDAAGNRTTSAVVTVAVSNVVDSTAPTVSLSAPAAGATLTGTTTLSATASDNIGVAGVRFTIDGTTVGVEDTSSPFSISWNSASVSSGQHTVRAVARDAAGNTQTSAARTVTVANLTDTAAPSVSITAPAGGTTLSGAVSVSASASDNTGVIGVQFKLDGTNFGSEDLTSPYVVSWPTNLTVNGTHTLTATARDAAGNTRTSSSVSVIVDNRGTGVSRDFNGDGLPDLVFESTTGQLYSWFLSGGTSVGGGALVPGAVDPVWQIVGLDDFNGDGRTDLLWQHSVTGQLYIWLMDRLTLIGVLAPQSAAPDWRVAGTGDFNGDGKPDILWKHRMTGGLYVWLMNGATMIGGSYLNPQSVDPVWRLVGIADMDRDGRSDLLWQHSGTGAIALWWMNGMTALKAEAFATPGMTPDWQIKSVADYDRDGSPDLIWQNSLTGELRVWYLHSSQVAREGPLTPSQVAPTWQVVGSQ